MSNTGNLHNIQFYGVTKANKAFLTFYGSGCNFGFRKFKCRASPVSLQSQGQQTFTMAKSRGNEPFQTRKDNLKTILLVNQVYLSVCLSVWVLSYLSTLVPLYLFTIKYETRNVPSRLLKNMRKHRKDNFTLCLICFGDEVSYPE
jgi:hypothetical protein